MTRLPLQSTSGIPSGIEVYYKEQQTLQNSPGITKCDKLLLKKVSGITKCESYYQVRRNTGDHGKN